MAEQNTLRIPVGKTDTGTIIGAQMYMPPAMTEQQWQQMHRVLEAMKPTLVVGSDADASEIFCDQCSGPFPADVWPGNEYGGHWDTCPNRPAVQADGGL